MTKLSKRMNTCLKKRPPEALPLSDAVDALKKYDGTKFDQSVEVAMRLGVACPRRFRQNYWRGRHAQGSAGNVQY